MQLQEQKVLQYEGLAIDDWQRHARRSKNTPVQPSISSLFPLCVIRVDRAVGELSELMTLRVARNQHRPRDAVTAEELTNQPLHVLLNKCKKAISLPFPVPLT